MFEPMRIEHHDNFTAVYLHSHLAFMCLVGTKEQREAVPDETWYNHATIPSLND